MSMTTNTIYLGISSLTVHNFFKKSAAENWRKGTFRCSTTKLTCDYHR